MSLLDKLKQVLRILDNDNDELLETILSNSKADLEDLAGVELDFEKEGLAQSLLLDNCRYSFHNASEYFEENYQTKLNRLIFQEGAKTYAEED